MKKRYAEAHMKVAYLYAELSYCERRKVGCVIVKDDRIISIGYNGTMSGWSNCCEDEHGKTKPEVSHAEENAITKLAASTESGEGASVFVTTAPCLPCSKMLANMKVNEVYYSEDYRGKTEGIEHLKKAKVKVKQLQIK